MNKRVGIPIIKERGTPAPQYACDPLQTPDQLATNLNMQIQRVRTPSECVRINWKDAHAYKCEHMIII